MRLRMWMGLAMATLVGCGGGQHKGASGPKVDSCTDYRDALGKAINSLSGMDAPPEAEGMSEIEIWEARVDTVAAAAAHVRPAAQQIADIRVGKDLAELHGKV